MVFQVVPQDEVGELHFRHNVRSVPTWMEDIQWLSCHAVGTINTRLCRKPVSQPFLPLRGMGVYSWQHHAKVCHHSQERHEVWGFATLITLCWAPRVTLTRRRFFYFKLQISNFKFSSSHPVWYEWVHVFGIIFSPGNLWRILTLLPQKKKVWTVSCYTLFKR